MTQRALRRIRPSGHPEAPPYVRLRADLAHALGELGHPSSRLPGIIWRGPVEKSAVTDWLAEVAEEVPGLEIADLQARPATTLHRKQGTYFAQAILPTGPNTSLWQVGRRSGEMPGVLPLDIWYVRAGGLALRLFAAGPEAVATGNVSDDAKQHEALRHQIDTDYMEDYPFSGRAAELHDPNKVYGVGTTLLPGSVAILRRELQGEPLVAGAYARVLPLDAVRWDAVLHPVNSGPVPDY